MVTCMKKLNKTRKRYNLKNIWTSNRKILYKEGFGKNKVYHSYNLVVNRHLLCYGGKTGSFILLFLFLV